MDKKNYTSTDQLVDLHNYTEHDLLQHALVDVYESVITDEDAELDELDSEDPEIVWLRHERLGHKSLHWSARPSILMIATVTFSLALALSISILPKMELLVTLLCKIQSQSSTSPSTFTCDPLLAQQQMATMEGLSKFFGGVLAMLASTRMGQLSDIKGRKALLSLNIAAGLLEILLQGYLLRPSAASFSRTLFVISSCIYPLTGGEHVLLATSMSYVIDIVEEDQRIYSLGLMTLTLSVGVAIGPLLSSAMISWLFHQPIYAYHVTVLFFLVLLLCSVFVVPESRSERSRKLSQTKFHSQETLRRSSMAEFSGAEAVTLSVRHWCVSFVKPFKLLWLPVEVDPVSGRRDYRARITVLKLVLAQCFFNYGFLSSAASRLFYILFKCRFDALGLNYYISASAVTELLCLIVVTPIVLHFLKTHFSVDHKLVDLVDLTAMLGSYSFGLLSITVTIFLQKPFWFYMSAVFDGLVSLYDSTNRAAITKYAPANTTGALYGALSAISAFNGIIGPLASTMLYSFSVKTHPRLFLVVLWILTFICGLILVSIVPVRKTSVEETDLENGAVQET